MQYFLAVYQLNWRIIMKKTLIYALNFVLIFSASSLAVTNGEFHYDRVLIRISDSAGPIVIDNNSSPAKFGVPALDNIAHSLGITKIERLFKNLDKPSESWRTDLSGIYTLYFPPEADVFRVIEVFKNCEFTVYAEPYYIRKFYFTPNDPSISQQYALTNIQAYLAWDYCQGDPDVVVCIDDTGIDIDHPDLVNNLWVNPGEDLNGNGIVDPGETNGVDDDQNGHVDDFWGWDFVGNDNNPNDDAFILGGHGTHCSGIASAVTNNGVGIAGTGFSASIMTARVGYSILVLYPFEGVEYAIENNADVISMSWGGGGYSQTEQDMFNYANELGITCVAAAGNDGSSSPGYPASYNNVISVAATDQQDLKASFSNYGSTIDVSAPGVSIYSTYLNGNYQNMDGTSMACPMAAGLATLIKAAYPDLQADCIEMVMKYSADNIDAINPGYEGALGSGRINANKAMNMLHSQAAITLTPHQTQIQIPPAGGQFQYDRLIQNTSANPRTVGLYTRVIMPNGSYYRISNELNQTIPAGGQIQNLNMNQNIPSGAPAGIYTYVLIAFDAGVRVPIAIDYFTFEKTAAFDQSSSGESWDLSFDNCCTTTADASSAAIAAQLHQASPNPFNPTTSLTFSLPQAAQVSLIVYDLQGRQIAVLADGWKNAGEYQADFDGTSHSSGVYFAVLKVGGSSQIQKITLLK